MVNFVNHGVTYNMENIWEYLEKDFWDVDDLKFDFWGRMARHSMITNEVFRLNGVFDSKEGPGGMTIEELRDMRIEKNKHKKRVVIEYSDEFIKYLESPDDD